MESNKGGNQGNGSSNLWSFENLKGSENYKPWSRRARNALETMKVWYTCVEHPPTQPSDYEVDEEGEVKCFTFTSSSLETIKSKNTLIDLFEAVNLVR